MELATSAKERQVHEIVPSLADAELQTTSGENEGISAQLNQTLTVHIEATLESHVSRREELNRLKVKDENEKDKVSTRIHKSGIDVVK